GRRPSGRRPDTAGETLMEPLIRIEAVACALPFINVDTDQIFPARYMKQPRSEGYDRYFFHDVRRDGSGALSADFPLNASANEGARILVARRNFGSGSS